MLEFFKDEAIYYPTPCQVIFLREVDGKPTYRKGIVLHEWIVDAADGAKFSTRKVLKYARKCGVDVDYAIVESFEWIPIQIE